MPKSSKNETKASAGSEPLREPFRKLRESLRNLEKNPPPEEVHKLRIQARRIESIASALAPAAGGKARRLIKPVKQLRKAAGGVRDMDVLAANALSLRDRSEEASLARLLDYLTTERARNALKLLKTVDREGKSTRKSLRRYSRLIKSTAPPANGGKPGSAASASSSPLVAAADELKVLLELWPLLTARNIHPFRLKVKELRYVLQALPGADQGFVDALGAVKDQIGEWHDWQQLAEVANGALPDPADQALLTEIAKTVRKKLSQAKAISNAMREHWLDRPARSSVSTRRKK